MAGSSFAYVKSIECTGERRVPVDDLLQRALAYAGTSPAALGAEKERFLAELRATIAPHAVDGMLRETLATWGSVFARRPGRTAA